MSRNSISICRPGICFVARLAAVICLTAWAVVSAGSSRALNEGIRKDDVAGREIVQGAIRAMGGTSAFDQVRNLSMLGMTRVWIGDQELQGSAHYTYARPDKYRVDVDLRPVKFIQAFNGKVGWGLENLKPYPPEINERIARSMQVALTRGLLALLHFDAGRSKIKVVAREEIDSTKVDVVDFEDGAGNTTQFSFDVTTHLPRRAIYADIDAEGNPVETTDSFFNFRKAGALRWPYRVVQFQGGIRKREDIFTEIQVNGKVDRSFFEPIAP